MAKKCLKRKIKTLQAIGCTQLYKDFAVDSMGWPLVDMNPSLSEGWEHPPYPWFSTRYVVCLDLTTWHRMVMVLLSEKNMEKFSCLKPMGKKKTVAILETTTWQFQHTGSLGETRNAWYHCVAPCSLWRLCEPEHTLQKGNFLARNMLSRSSCWGS